MDIKENSNVEPYINGLDIGDIDNIGRYDVHVYQVFGNWRWGVFKGLVRYNREDLNFSSDYTTNQIRILRG